jgi:hypothetical protein
MAGTGGGEGGWGGEGGRGWFPSGRPDLGATESDRPGSRDPFHPGPDPPGIARPAAGRVGRRSRRARATCDGSPAGPPAPVASTARRVGMRTGETCGKRGGADPARVRRANACAATRPVPVSVPTAWVCRPAPGRVGRGRGGRQSGRARGRVDRSRRPENRPGESVRPGRAGPDRERRTWADRRSGRRGVGRSGPSARNRGSQAVV